MRQDEYEVIATVASTGPGIEVARAIRRALAAAGWKAAAVDTVVIGGDLDFAGNAAALAAVRRGLGRFADGVTLLMPGIVQAGLRTSTTGCAVLVSFRRDGGATVTACRLREVAG